MSNVLSEEQRQEVIALGRLGWSLRRIQREAGIRRETISGYLKEAEVALRPPRGRQIRAKPPSRAGEVTPNPTRAKPASQPEEVTPTSGGESAGETPKQPEPQPASACEPYGEAIEVGLSKGRNAKAIWQDLVDVFGFTGGYQSVTGSYAGSVGSGRRRPVGSSRPRPAKNSRSITAVAPWSAMRTLASTGAGGYSY